MTYNPETHWSYVGQEIEKRVGDNVIAGDDNPFFAYKRSKFLRRFLDTIDFNSKTIMEVGFGPGGNLRHIAAHYRPRFIFGADFHRRCPTLHNAICALTQTSNSPRLMAHTCRSIVSRSI